MRSLGRDSRWGGVDLHGSERSLVWMSMWTVGKSGEFNRKELGFRVRKA